MTNIKCWGIRFYISRQTQQACCLTLTAEIGVRSLMIIVVARNANIFLGYGSVSKPCTPGEHQNSW